MLLSVMIACALAAVLLFLIGAFDELRAVWQHPDHRAAENEHRLPRPKVR